MTTTATTFGEALRAARTERQLTQQQLADMLGVNQVYISQLESGIKRNPKLSTLVNLAKALNCDVSMLIPKKIS